ncbi:MAG: hypothetical protein ACRD04_02535 [Terriglobales bacterium]
MGIEDANVDLWSLPSSQLARDCQTIAESAPAEFDPALHAEAVRMSAEWQEALKKPTDQFDDRARKAGQIAALRMRTIEILLKIRSRA